MPAQSDEAPLLGHSFLGTSFGRRELGNFVGSLTRVGFPDGSGGKESACNVGDPGSVPGLRDPLEKGMAIHSNILA